MRTSEPKTIRLKDYREPPFLIDQVDLRVELFEDGARVHSRLDVRRNPSVQPESELHLDGEDLKLEEVTLNGEHLSASRYVVEDSQLTIRDMPDSAVVGVVTWIKPQENTRLEGLYKSSGMFCTQCEAEGFRRITYYLDRPDVMARFRTRIEADLKRYPILLANGNEVDRSPLEEGRHQVTWEDPFPKPAYLFALVGGDLVERHDSFETVSGRNVALRMYVEPRNQEKCDHALAALKRAMRWDEEVYGREYDLDVFMIVAVDDFNMGAMENKGLNIFNSSCVLASPETATDAIYDRIESIVAHEYFHNWSGNRVTCRDWFQLSLKEGFTVFRDSEYSADQGSRTVNRIDSVNMLRTAQFAEDSGPMAHPIRPAEYMEITNFYTVTIYEKGAEVVRMIHSLLGPELFRAGSDLYFERHDGQAVTTDDFVRAMEDASGRDLTQFRRWYDQAGTPELAIEDSYDAASQTYRLSISQSCPPTPGQPEKAPFHLPFELGLLGTDGQDLELQLEGSEPSGRSMVLDITEPRQEFVFTNITARPVPSLLRGFTAPVRLRYPWTRDQLMFLISHDSDGFNRWDASQRLATDVIEALAEGREAEVDARLVSACSALLKNDALDPALVAKMLSLPSLAYLIELTPSADVLKLHQAREQVLTSLARSLRDDLHEVYQRHPAPAAYRYTSEDMAARALRNMALAWLLSINDEQALKLARSQYGQANNMTDRLGALRAVVNSDFAEARQTLLDDFYQQWQADPQVVELWFAVQAASPQAGTLPHIKALMEHAAFDWKNPNKVRSVIGAFAGQNLVNFHAPDGSGYSFLAEQVIRLDPSNPQIAARLVSPLTRWKKFKPETADAMQRALREVMGQPKLSRDTYEIVSKGLS
ncbi:aminopeptidase N [Hydrocarboniclastica marina]|uniref:Aminopeptidase N n=1 Tax=Hydrocarboniclastica marina TaxID=2259620 RepID=A0A4P7XET1_9ALTE|nr:aminopeptidase N [Hydrocarboniclastica marina]QCF25418.1 aminopeptidase N [Hydrocarboniclastica marina]